jgi:hypothetical protein
MDQKEIEYVGQLREELKRYSKSSDFSNALIQRINYVFGEITKLDPNFKPTENLSLSIKKAIDTLNVIVPEEGKTDANIGIKDDEIVPELHERIPSVRVTSFTPTPPSSSGISAVGGESAVEADVNIPSSSGKMDVSGGSVVGGVRKIIGGIATKVGGVVSAPLVNAASAIKLALSGDPKNILKAGAMGVGWLFGGPFGAGVVLLLGSGRGRRSLRELIARSFKVFAWWTVGSLTVLTLLTAFFVFVINSGEFIVPPGEDVSFFEEGIGGEYPKCWPTKGIITQEPYPASCDIDVENSHCGYKSNAIDIGAPRGEEIYGTHDGVVTTGFDKYGYGNYIIIKSEHGFSTRYGHLLEIFVSDGQKVKAGALIGKMDGDPRYDSKIMGRSTGSHLHYELRGLSRSIDKFVPKYSLRGPTEGCFARDSGGSDKILEE